MDQQAPRRGKPRPLRSLCNFLSAIGIAHFVTVFGWRSIFDRKSDVVREFTIPFVRTANRVGVYGSPASIAAMDEIQEGFAMLNRAKGEAEREAAEKAIRIGHDHFVIAARE